MKDLIGCKCRCIFNLPGSEWPTGNGHPAWVEVVAIDMPMVCMRSSFGGKDFWINASAIQTIEFSEKIDGWKDLAPYEIEEAFDAMPGGSQGFCKTWGYEQFARVIEEKLREKNARSDG